MLAFVLLAACGVFVKCFSVLIYVRAAALR